MSSPGFQESLITETVSGIQCESLVRIINRPTLKIVQRVVYIGKTLLIAFITT